MSIAQKVYLVGTTPQTVVAPTNDYAKFVLKNIQPETVMDYAREGYLFLVGQQFTIGAGATVSFSFQTGATGAQLDFYTIITDAASVWSNLIEGATVTVTGSAIPAYNMNRNYSDTHQAVLKAASAVTGGTAISSEFATASIHGGGQSSSSKIQTLEASTQYAMSFTNQGNQSTTVFFQLGFSEHYNGLNTIWLDTIDDSFALRAGEELILELLPNATINAVSHYNTNKLAVMRQK